MVNLHLPEACCFPLSVLHLAPCRAAASGSACAPPPPTMRGSRRDRSDIPVPPRKTLCGHKTSWFLGHVRGTAAR